MVPVAIAGNISGEATTPSGNIFNEAMRGPMGCPALSERRPWPARVPQPQSALPIRASSVPDTEWRGRGSVVAVLAAEARPREGHPRRYCRPT
jgi:hypothetical protein